MSRIREAFERLKNSGRGAFIPFLTAGDPDLETTELLMRELVAAGADIIELGVPFSDPVADGKVIQRASERALGNGVTVADVLACAARAKQRCNIPLVLFSYFNPLLGFGLERLVAEAKRAGIDGILVVDLIPEEAQPWLDILRANQLDPIFLVAPTTSDARLARIAKQACGFIYAIARAGVTGARTDLMHDAEAVVQRVRQVTDLPVAVGFGISTAEQVHAVWRFADAAVIGSAIVAEIEKRGRDPHLAQQIGDFARLLIAPA